MTTPFDPFPGLRPIGYWKDHDQPDLPDPTELIDHSWDPQERQLVGGVLGAGATHQPGEGCSLCRICGSPNGFLDLNDGTYVWPEGLAHYVTEHSVRLPVDVVSDLLARRPASELGPWTPLSVPALVELFATAQFRWWLAGGHALEAHLDRSWRDHDDIDIGISRSDAPRLFDLLDGWDIHLANDGVLTQWSGQPLAGSAALVSNLWCRPSPSEPWALDVLIGEGTAQEWIYKRDPSVRRPWREGVLRTSSGLPYLAPEIQLLFKSGRNRPKDQIDAAAVIPELTPIGSAWLAQHLTTDHPWQAEIETR